MLTAKMQAETVRHIKHTLRMLVGSPISWTFPPLRRMVAQKTAVSP